MGAIATAIPGGVAENIVSRYLDPRATRLSYATADVNGCTGTMIGPNILMTAGQCLVGGPGETVLAYFDAWQARDPTRLRSEAFECEYLVSTFDDSDLALLFCHPNNENPGDRYGYVDFDPRPVEVGEPLVSVWSDKFDDVASQRGRVYSEGAVTQIELLDWYTRDVTRGGFGYRSFTLGVFGIESSVFGCSAAARGAVQVDPLSYRVRLGPTTTEGAPSDADICRATRYGASMHDYFLYASASTGERSVPHVNEELIASLRPGLDDPTDPEEDPTDSGDSAQLDPSAYYGFLDADRDEVFDIQHEVEMLRGESRRDHIYLDFENRRRNAMWTVTDAPTVDVRFDPQRGTVTVVDETVCEEEGWSCLQHALTHTRLKLDWNQVYRATITYTLTSGHAHLLLVHPDAGIVNWQPLPTGSGEQTISVELLSSVEDPHLVIATAGGTRATFSELNLARWSAIYSFDVFDDRMLWTTPSGQPAHVLPEGKGAQRGGDLNWAGLVPVGNNGSRGGRDFQLVNRRTGMVRNRIYKICFDYRTFDADPMGPGGKGIAMVESPSQVVGTIEFDIFAGFSFKCFPWFRAPSSQLTLSFGTETDDSTTGAYVVDDVQVLNVSITSNPNTPPPNPGEPMD
jgi:hypothetical protein